MQTKSTIDVTEEERKVFQVLESWRKRLDISSADTDLLEQVKVCAEISISCMDFDPEKRPPIQHIIDKLDETESIELQCTNQLTLEPKLVGQCEEITYNSTDSMNIFIKYSIINSLVAQNRRPKIFIISNNQRGLLNHSMTFDTFAIDPAMKEAILKDLCSFMDGKSCTRAYLLCGPSGTGKTSLVSAMANFLNYDIYHLDSVTHLRKLFIPRTRKSIVVIDNIECSIDFTAARKNKKTGEHSDMDKMDSARQDAGNKMTPSDIFSLSNGLWSACGSEKLIIVFTTRRPERLDPALIRRGMTDVHIELPYCRFEQFKILAKIYLGIESHELFSVIQELLEKVDMTPADVARELMRTSVNEDVVSSCLGGLVCTLETMAEGQVVYEMDKMTRQNRIINYLEAD